MCHNKHCSLYDRIDVLLIDARNIQFNDIHM